MSLNIHSEQFSSESCYSTRSRGSEGKEEQTQRILERNELCAENEDEGVANVKRQDAICVLVLLIVFYFLFARIFLVIESTSTCAKQKRESRKNSISAMMPHLNYYCHWETNLNLFLCWQCRAVQESWELIWKLCSGRKKHRDGNKVIFLVPSGRKSNSLMHMIIICLYIKLGEWIK